MTENTQNNALGSQLLEGKGGRGCSLPTVPATIQDFSRNSAEEVLDNEAGLGIFR